MEKKIKILFISNIAAKKIGSFAMASIKAAQGSNFEFHIASNFNAESIEQRTKDEIEYKIQIHHIDFERNPLNFKNIKAFKQLVELIKKEKFDIIHCNTPTGGLYGRLAAKICGVEKVIYQAHGFHFYKGAPLKNWLIYYPIERILAHITDKILTINQEDFELSKKFKLRKKGTVHYIHGVGIDTKEYKNLEVDKLKFRKSLGLDEENIISISMGDLILRKNYRTSIEAISRLRNKNVHYLICGKGPEEKRLKKLCQKLKIEDQVHFLGFRSDIKELLAISDIFLFTTNQEGMPRSMMEAMASGLTCIASKIRGNTDLIDEGKGGFLISPDDFVEFAKKIDYICENKNIKYEMGKYNLEKIKEFDINNIENELEKVYMEVL